MQSKTCTSLSRDGGWKAKNDGRTASSGGEARSRAASYTPPGRGGEGAGTDVFTAPAPPLRSPPRPRPPRSSRTPSRGTWRGGGGDGREVASGGAGGEAAVDVAAAAAAAASTTGMPSHEMASRWGCQHDHDGRGHAHSTQALFMVGPSIPDPCRLQAAWVRVVGGAARGGW